MFMSYCVTCLPIPAYMSLHVYVFIWSNIAYTNNKNIDKEKTLKNNKSKKKM